MKIRPVGADLYHADRRTDRQTDMTKLIVAEICAVLGYYAALSGRSVPTFRGNQ
jgi:hypothetical protein